MSSPHLTNEKQNIYRHRLLMVAKALRESPKPDSFTMEEYFRSDCGTPACALGHYAFREDLQSEFYWDKKNAYPRLRANDATVAYDDSEFHEHFGIDYEEAECLFSADGCGGAQTANEAAEYIEQFVEERYPLTALQVTQP